ncbi:MAG: PAS domain-containing sensor histidine kinase [Candidatus Zixiibacteriota bacterium]
MFSGSKKLLLVALFVIALIALVNLAWWLHYNRTEKLVDHQLSRRLSAVAKNGTIALKPEQIENMLLDDISAFANVSAILEEIRQSDSLAETFILDQNYHILASTSIEADSIYFLMELNGKYIDSVFFALTELTIATPSYKTGSVFLKSAFAPLYDSEGFIIAVLGVEANVDYFDALTDMKKNLYYSSLLSVIGGMLIGLIFLLFQRRINAAEQQIFLNQTHSYLGRMVAVVSHEIKNPLMIVRASAERLFKKVKGDEPQFIIEEVDRLNQIVTGYLDFASTKNRIIESEKLESVNLVELITNIKKHFQSKYPEHQINWLENNYKSAVIIDSYPRSLRQVILNLLINGADACLAVSKPIAIGVAIEDNSAEVVISITDCGPGLSKKEIKKIFTPFYTTKQSGSGLGLYLCKKIIEDMKGVIDIKSQKGKGTKLIIKLPRGKKVK